MATTHENVNATNEENHVDGNSVYEIVRTLGEGAFGEVKLVVNRVNPNLALAVKCVDMRLHIDKLQELKKEALIQKKCSIDSHPNILKYIGVRHDLILNQFQIVLEYADGGEVFDQIVPDVGLPTRRAKFYFRQLLCGLAHMHKLGVAHRDIKPENLLLTKDDVLKIADFGMATIFKNVTNERKLCSPCGTPPYVAPEVLEGEYRAEPVDIWSAGVVLVTFLAGELPWESPVVKNPGFSDWVSSPCTDRYPWKKMAPDALNLLRKVLEVEPEKRITLEKLQEHRWVSNDSGPGPAKRSRLDNGADAGTAVSQPIVRSGRVPLGSMAIHQPASFSQPQVIDDLILSKTQMADYSQGGFKDPLYNLARRMTRFCVSVPMDDAIKRLKSACESEGYSVDEKSPIQFVITHRKMAFMVTFLDMNEGGLRKLMLDFRRSRGDGLEFKRAFVNMKNQLADVICTTGNQWLATQGLTPEPMEEEVY